MEMLESRMMFAAVVSITTTGTYIDVVGDGSDNVLSVTGNFNSGSDSFFGSYTINTSAGTSLSVDGVNVGTSYFSPDGVLPDAWDLKPWRFQMGGGNDFVSASNSYFPAVTVDLGAGNDRVELRLMSSADFGLTGSNQATRGVSISAGDGDDNIYLTYGARKAVYGSVSIFPGAGRDRVTIADVPENQPERIGISGEVGDIRFAGAAEPFDEKS